MKRKNIKIVSTLTLIVSLNTGIITTHAADMHNDENITNNQQVFTTSTVYANQVINSKNVFLPKNKESAVTLWAEALKQRSGAFRYAILTNDLKDQEYKKYSEENWVIGGSSPKIVSYKINEKNKIDGKTSEYEINYTLIDSTKTLYHSKENINITQLGEICFVTKHDNYEYLPEITK